MLRAYVAIEPAEVCYPFEAVAWVAFGKMPQAHLDDGGWETRGDAKAIANGYSPSGEDLFSNDEMSNFFENEVEAGRYFAARYIDPAVKSVDEYFNGDAVFHQRARGYVKQGPRLESGFIEAKFVEVAEARISLARERARLKVHLALLDGRLSATGLRIPGEWHTVSTTEWTDEFWDDLVGIERSNIPAEEWASASDAWHCNPEDVRTSKYLYPLVAVADLLQVFEAPDVGEVEISGFRIGATLFIDDSEKNEKGPSKLPRGRQRKGDGAIAVAVKNEFARRLRDGSLPGKKEAIVQEVIGWVESVFDQEISRTTAQRYLAPVLELL